VAANVFDVIADAQQGKLYAQTYRRPAGSGAFVSAGPIAVVNGAQWVRERDPLIPVVGPGLRIAREWLPARATAVPADASIAGLLAAGLARWDARQVADLFQLEPIYVRASSAEEQWTRRGSVPT
jgi:tRNA A37 threonylcarbamoyladenosine modification protein TsaB